MTVLRGALLVDGTGAPPRPADVVIEADQIAAVEAPGTASGDGDVVNLDGLVLAPGFIDCHTHYDAQVLWDPDLTPSSWHGVTTVVMGNCGFGIAPTRPGRPGDDRADAGERRGHVGGSAVRGHPLDLRDLPRVPGRGRAGRAEAERGGHARSHPAAAVRAGRGGGRAGRHLGRDRGDAAARRGGDRRRRHRLRVLAPARPRRGLGQARAQPARHRGRADAARRAAGRARPRHVRDHARTRLRPRRARRAVRQDRAPGHLDGAERLTGRLPPAGQGRGPRRRGLAPGRVPPDRLPGHPGRASAVRPRRRVRAGAVRTFRRTVPVLPGPGLA